MTVQMSNLVRNVVMNYTIRYDGYMNQSLRGCGFEPPAHTTSSILSDSAAPGSYRENHLHWHYAIIGEVGKSAMGKEFEYFVGVRVCHTPIIMPFDSTFRFGTNMPIEELINVGPCEIVELLARQTALRCLYIIAIIERYVELVLENIHSDVSTSVN